MPAAGKANPNRRLFDFSLERNAMYTVTCLSPDREAFSFRTSAGDSMLDAARRAGIGLDAPCSGHGICGKCKIQLISGQVEEDQRGNIRKEEYEAGWRLACRIRPLSDCTVRIPDASFVSRENMIIAGSQNDAEKASFMSNARLAGVFPDTDLLPFHLQLPKPSDRDTRPDLERLCDELKKAFGYEHLRVPFYILKSLARVLRRGDFSVSGVLETDRDNRAAQVLSIWPDRTYRRVQEKDIRQNNAAGREERMDNNACFAGTERERLAGAAFDIGTTTVVGILADLQTGEILAQNAAANAQLRYGADVISRIIESCREEEDEIRDGKGEEWDLATGEKDGSERLQNALIRETLNPMIRRMCSEAGLEPDRISRICIAANTTMNHLLCGVYADPIRLEPWVPSFFDAEDIRAGDLNILSSPGARVILSPNIGSYVGGDITVGTYVSGLWDRPELSLFIDLGTNGEIVLGNKEFMLSCACSAGPAFEGGDISCGMRAAQGAVDTVRINPQTMEPSFTVIGDTNPAGLCGSGMIDLTAELFRCSIIDRRGKFVRSGRRIRRDEDGIGFYILSDPDRPGPAVEFSEVDIDNFIRARGAVFSAIRTMLRQMDLSADDIESICIAGGIGSGINIENAVQIGMLPDVERSRFHYLGNTSLEGAYRMLISDEAVRRVLEVSRRMTYIELSRDPSYMEEFVASCFLPHTNETLFPSAARKKDGT